MNLDGKESAGIKQGVKVAMWNQFGKIIWNSNLSDKLLEWLVKIS